MYRVRKYGTRQSSKNDLLHAATSQLDIRTYKTIKLQTALWSTAVKAYVNLGLRQLKKRGLTLCRRTSKRITLVSKEAGNSGV